MTLKAISLLLLFLGTVLALPALAGNGWAMGLRARIKTLLS